jgi:hypothetical protein
VRIQEPRTHAEFLEASPAEVEAALHPTVPSLTDSLDRLVLEQIPAISAFFAIDLRFRWTDLGGSQSLPGLGIFLDRRQLSRLRDSVDAFALGDVVRFVLAHEAAHLAQHRVYSATSLAEPTRLRAKECDADIWGAMAVINNLADLNVAPNDAFDRMQRASALAFTLGTPVWDAPHLHPTPTQRLICVSTGLNAGLHLRLVRTYERTRDPKLEQQVAEWRKRDAQWFGPGDDVWKWTNQRAKALTNFEGTQHTPAGWTIDQRARFRILATAVERGRAALRQDVALLERALAPPGLVRCAVLETDSATSITCESQPFASLAIAKASYEADTILITGIEALGWRRVSAAGSDPSGQRRCYVVGAPIQDSLCVELKAGYRRTAITGWTDN